MRAAIAVLLLGACASPGADARPPLELTIDDRLPDESCGARWVAGVRGRVRDELGQPVDSGLVQMCLRTEDHSQLCLAPEPIDADGWYRVVLDREIRCLEQVTLRVTQEDQPTSVAFCRLPMRPVYGVLDAPDDLVLHRLDAPTELPARGDPGSMRTLRFGSGLELDVVPRDLEFPDTYDRLAARPVDPAAAPCWGFEEEGSGEEAPALDGLWAFGPEAGIDPGAGMRLPETTGLPDGAPVELWLVGGTYTLLPDGAQVEEGELVRYGAGHVQGGHVVPDPGSELPYLSWVGYRAAR